MKKIGILCLTNSQNGGVYQYTQTMVNALLSDKTNEYVIITTKDNNEYDDKGVEVLKVDKDFDSLFVKIATMLVSITGVKFIWQAERKLFASIDMFISPAISLYPHYWLKAPYIITIHDLHEKYFPQFYTLSQRIKRAITNTLAAKRSQHIICESDYVKKDIIKYLKIQPSKISVIQSPPLLAVRNFEYKQEYLAKIKNKYSLPEKYLFYPAQFWHHKNHERLLEAFSILVEKYPDLHLVFTGGDPDARPQALKKYNSGTVIRKIREMNLSQKVRLLGYVDYGDLAGIYIRSEMLVVPTLFESVSLPIYEAFYLNVPVCASNVVALPEQVGDAGLVFDPQNTRDIAEKITEMIENKDLRKKCVENGAIKIQQLNMVNYSQALVRVINQVELKTNETP